MVVDNFKYIKWLSAEDMHLMTKQWLSELQFVKGEQHFFEELIRKYIFQLIQPERFKESGQIVKKLADLQKDNEDLIRLIQSHENGLEVLVDGKDELVKEEVYKAEHHRMIIVVNDFLEKYRELKNVLFKTISSIVKSEKKIINI